MKTLVTGASRGIGRAIALRLAAEGSDLIIASRSSGELARVAEEVRHRGRRCIAIETDLRNPESIARLAARASEELDGIDALVNNAGVGAWGSIEELSLSQYEEMFDVNVRAVFLLTQSLLPGMIARGAGTIINIGSTSGRRAYSSGTLYCASKFALSGFSEALAKELQPKGIRVCTVFPGSVNTYLGGSGPEDWQPGMLTPEDIAEAVQHQLAAPAHVFTTEIVVWPRGEEIL